MESAPKKNVVWHAAWLCTTGAVCAGVAYEWSYLTKLLLAQPALVVTNCTADGEFKQAQLLRSTLQMLCTYVAHSMLEASPLSLYLLHAKRRTAASALLLAGKC